MNVIIVGNGPSLLQEEMGKLIDEYDVVIRMKRCSEQLRDFPEYYGTKTDILAGSLTIAAHLKTIPADMYWILLDSRHQTQEAQHLLYDMCEIYYKNLNMEVHPELANQWRELYMAIRDEYPVPEWDKQMKASQYCDERGEKHPSQGFQTLVYAAALLNPERITLVGFDNLMTGEFTWSVTRGPKWDHYPQHRWDIEHIMLPLVEEEYGVEIGYMLPDIPQEKVSATD